LEKKEGVKKEARGKIKVTILDRRDIITYPKLKAPFTSRAVTYLVEGYPPKTIWIPKDEWSEEEESKRIKKDIEERKLFKPITKEV